jgi:hypothetical protein
VFVSGELTGVAGSNMPLRTCTPARDCRLWLRRIMLGTVLAGAGWVFLIILSGTAHADETLTQVNTPPAPPPADSDQPSAGSDARFGTANGDASSGGTSSHLQPGPSSTGSGTTGGTSSTGSGTTGTSSTGSGTTGSSTAPNNMSGDKATDAQSGSGTSAGSETAVTGPEATATTKRTGSAAATPTAAVPSGSSPAAVPDCQGGTKIQAAAHAYLASTAPAGIGSAHDQSSSSRATDDKTSRVARDSPPVAEPSVPIAAPAPLAPVNPPMPAPFPTRTFPGTGAASGGTSYGGTTGGPDSSYAIMADRVPTLNMASPPIIASATSHVTAAVGALQARPD